MKSLRILLGIVLVLLVCFVIGILAGELKALRSQIEALTVETQTLKTEVRILTERLANAEALVFTKTIASYYGADHLGRPAREHGRLTASGTRFDAWAHTFACWHLPFWTRAIFIRKYLKNGEWVISATWGDCTDKGPAFRLKRPYDISYQMAWELGMLYEGVAEVGVAIVRVGEGT